MPANSTLNFSIRSSNLTAPAFSRGIDLSWRSNLITSFDTAEQPSLNGAGSMSIQFLSRTGIEMGDSVTVSFGRGLAFATSSLCEQVECFQ